MCGKPAEDLARALIERVELEVCMDCSKFGKVIAQVRRPSAREQGRQWIKKHAQQPKEEKIELIVEDYAELIKKKRESLGLSQKDFAVKINEKESLVHKIETGAFEPPIALAKKLEKILHVKLIEGHDEKFVNSRSEKGAGFTLGDFIRLKK